MTPDLLRTLALVLLVGLLQPVQAQEAPLRVGVIGGLDMAGVWAQLESKAQQALGLEITTLLTAPKERVLPAFMNGTVDALLIHGGDETFALEALGFAEPARVWAYSEFVLVGPRADPAALAGLDSGRAAIAALAASGQPLIQFRDVGSFGVLRRLLDEAGLSPRDLNLLPENTERPQQILRQAERENAYVIVGHIPYAFERMPSENLGLIISGDPMMRRAYVVVTPGPHHPAGAAARRDAARLAAFLTSDAVQNIMGAAATDELRWIFPRSGARPLVTYNPLAIF